MFLPLEKMMRAKLYSSLKEPFKTQLLASWDIFLLNQIQDIFQTTEIISTSLPLQFKTSSSTHQEEIKAWDRS
jgi:hypothetical protein